MKAPSVPAGAVALRWGVLGGLYAAVPGVSLAMALPPYDARCWGSWCLRPCW
ncbi:MAG: hypothetical protein NZ874_04535 [Fimbriimonadales bacterium]|nr:hypothetical protein [Fimbriimonadales bacterium]